MLRIVGVSVSVALFSLGCGRLGFDPSDADPLGGDSNPANACRFRDVAVGGHQSCAINQDGAVYCWGPLVAKIDLPSTAKKLAMRESAQCALLDDQRVFCWGKGPVGDGTDEDRDVPVEISAGQAFRDIAASAQQFCAAQASDGVTQCWGPSPRNLSPIDIKTAAAETVNAVALAGGVHGFCATRADTSVLCWGETPLVAPGEVTSSVDPLVVAGLVGGDGGLVLGHDFGCVRDAAGFVACRGSSYAGELGRGDLSDVRQDFAAPMGLGVTRSVTAGARHACAVLENRTVRCWGDNDHGQLGLGNSTVQAMPQVVSQLQNANLVASKHAHTCADANGKIWCWGNDDAGQLGRGSRAAELSRTLVATPNGMRFTSVKMGATSACALATNGTVWCWGIGLEGQLGNGGRDSSLQPVQVALPAGFVAAGIAVGARTACAFDSAQTLCWGNNQNRTIGIDSDIARVLVPTVNLLPAGVVQVELDGKVGCARMVTGDVRCWGGANFPTPTLMSAALPAVLPPVESIAQSGQHYCALSNGGQAFCWGNNSDGQLGSGDRNSLKDPTEVMGGLVFTSIAADRSFSCGVVAGELYCWGDLNGVAASSVPTKVGLPGGLPAITEVQAGGGVVVATLVDGSRYFLGSVNGYRVGDGIDTNDPRSTSVPYQAIDFGDRNSCFVDAGGAVSCTGERRRGLIGDAVYSQATPQVVPVDCRQ